MVNSGLAAKIFYNRLRSRESYEQLAAYLVEVADAVMAYANGELKDQVGLFEAQQYVNCCQLDEMYGDFTILHNAAAREFPRQTGRVVVNGIELEIFSRESE